MSQDRMERVVDVFLRYLKAEDVEVIFGVPGGLLHYFFEAVDADPDLRLVVAKHEQGAAFMADGYARAGRRIGVCAGTSGPGSTNLLTGVACAYADGVPLLVITGQAARSAQGRGAAQEATPEHMDIVGVFKPVTKYSTMVRSPESLAHHLRAALRQALTGRPGPVHLNVPVDLWELPLAESWFAPQSYRPLTQAFDRKAVHTAADRLLAAELPVMLAGTGVARAHAAEHLLTLAEMLPARVATTPAAKGIFPENHPLSLGVLGYAGHAEASDTIFGDNVDVLLTVGASLNEPTTLNWRPDFLPKETLLQLDIDPHRIGRNYPVDVALVGDAQTILVELVYHAHRSIREGSTPRSRWHAEPPLLRGGERYDDPAWRTSEQVPLTPQRWRCDLEEVLPDDAVIVSDIGGHMFFNIHNLCIKENQRFLINFSFASMGHGTAAPVGVALATGRPVIAIVGDACFTMNGMELITAAEYDVPVVWIVENNNMHGIIYHGAKLVGRRQPMEAIRYRRSDPRGSAGGPGKSPACSHRGPRGSDDSTPFRCPSAVYRGF
ncbi:MAG: thiamine pyrophosphate-binding protein [Deltaproteobacteria bacterium]|nr:thiamine pyrophosphate-binding protein [Deltaproteobacteria bacterium]